MGLIPSMVLIIAIQQDALNDLSRFPDHYTSTHTLVFIGAHKEWLDAQRTTGLRSEYEINCYNLEEWNDEVVESTIVWSLLDESNDKDSYSRWSRIDNLKKLRKHIGESNYFSGTMPSPVPIWRFNRIN